MSTTVLITFNAKVGDTAVVSIMWNAAKQVTSLINCTQLPVQYAIQLPAGGGYKQDTTTNIKDYIASTGLTVPANFLTVYNSL